MKIKHSILSGIIFSGTCLFCYLGFAAYTNLSTQVDGTTINKDIWNDVINKINTIGGTYAPTGMVSAFYGSSCPTGWNAADGSGDEPKTDGTLGTLDLRGEFIRGLSNGRTGIDSGRNLASWQERSSIMGADTNPSPSILKTDNTWNIWTSGSSSSKKRDANLEEVTSFVTSPAFLIGFNSYASSSTTDSVVGKVRPRNIALLYCIKQ